MEGKASNGRRLKNDSRDIRNYVKRIELKAHNDFDAFINCAIYRALFGVGGRKPKALIRALLAEAERCKRDHEKVIERNR